MTRRVELPPVDEFGRRQMIFIPRQPDVTSPEEVLPPSGTPEDVSPRADTEHRAIRLATIGLGKLLRETGGGLIGHPLNHSN